MFPLDFCCQSKVWHWKRFILINNSISLTMHVHALQRNSRKAKLNLGTPGILGFSHLLPVKKREKHIEAYKFLENILQKLAQNAFQTEWRRKKVRKESAYVLKANRGLKKRGLSKCESQSQTDDFKASHESIIWKK